MRARTLTVRGIGLIGAGSAAIHQLRYAIGYGAAAPHALAAHGHGYLSVVLPGVVAAALIALAAGLIRVGNGRSDAGTDPADGAAAFPGSLLGLWLAATVALAAIYGTQETLEGAGAFAGGSWIGLALAIPAGLLVALAMRGAEAAEGLRAPAGLPVVFAARAAAHTALPSVAPRRVAVARLGARAPPPAFVVT